MKFVWLAMGGGGNVPPQLALCEWLTAHGHEVHAVVDDDVCDAAEARGIPTTATSAPHRPPELSGLELVDWVYAQCFLGSTYNADLLAAVERHQPDRLLIDGFLYDALVEAHATGIPFAAVGHILVAAAWGGPSAQRMDAKNLDNHNAHRERVGLEPVDTIRDSLLDAHWYLAMTYAMLDAPTARAWPRLHYIGAHVPTWSPVSIQLPSGEDPLVVVAFSTTQMGQLDIVQRVIDGLADLDVRVLVTTGPELADDDLDLPPNAAAVPFVPHDQILPDAALMISHVGHGSMAAAARHGVPILAIPMGRDQDRNAQVLADHGIGMQLPPTADSGEIATTTRELLADAAIRERVGELAERISHHPGLELAESILTASPDNPMHAEDFAPDRGRT